MQPLKSPKYVSTCYVNSLKMLPDIYTLNVYAEVYAAYTLNVYTNIYAVYILVYIYMQRICSAHTYECTH